MVAVPSDPGLSTRRSPPAPTCTRSPTRRSAGSSASTPTSIRSPISRPAGPSVAGRAHLPFAGRRQLARQGPVTSEDVAAITFENVLFKHHARRSPASPRWSRPRHAGAAHRRVCRGSRRAPGLPAPAERRRGPDPAEARTLRGRANPAHARERRSDRRPYKLRHLPARGPRRPDAQHRLLQGEGPGVERVVFRVIKDASTRILAFEQGEVDYIPARRRQGRRTGRRARSTAACLFATAGPGGGNCIMTVSFNLEREADGPLGGAPRGRARRRSRAPARPGPVRRGKIAAAPFSSRSAGRTTRSARGARCARPGRWRTLLDEAGFAKDASGVGDSLDMVHYPNFIKYAELMAQDLAKIGIALTPRPLDREATIDAIFMKRDFDTNLISDATASRGDRHQADVPRATSGRSRSRTPPRAATRGPGQDRRRRRERRPARPRRDLPGRAGGPRPGQRSWWLVETAARVRVQHRVHGLQALDRPLRRPCAGRTDGRA